VKAGKMGRSPVPAQSDQSRSLCNPYCADRQWHSVHKSHP
jgi:hypothetical protein